MSAPTADEIQTIARDAMNWVAHRVRNAPKSDGSNDPDKQVASMYPSWPLTAKVPPGYTISGAQGDGDYIKVPNRKGGCIRKGFKVLVTEKVDQNTLPPEDRIPDMLEGVPVYIVGPTATP